MLSKTPSRYLVQYHQRYSLQYSTHVTHVSTSLTLPMLAHHLRWHVILVRLLRNPRQHVNHTGTSLTLARHQSKHTTHVSTPPTHACQPRHPRWHKQDAISRTPVYPVKLLKYLVFIFTTFPFQVFLSIFIELWNTAIEKLNFFQRKPDCLTQKTTIFSKTNAQFFLEKTFFQKKLFYIF